MAQLALIFKWFAVSSAQAAILVCMVLGVQRLFGKRLGAKWQWALWLLVVARLVLPWAPESSMSIFNAVPALGHQTREASPVAERQPVVAPAAQPAVITMPAVEGGAALQASTVQQVSPARPVPEPSATQLARGARPAAKTGAMGVVAFVWLVGALGLVAFAAGQGLLLAMRLRREPRVSEGGILSILDECKAKAGITTALAVVETRWVKSPALFGIRRPILLLPEGTTKRLTGEELGFVFLHELAHLKRHDLEINWLVSALQFAHWFNPVLWYGFYRMRADREVACDALVLSHTQPGEAARYGRTIVGLLEGAGRPRRLAGMVGILEDKSQLKRRITMIAKFQPGARKWSILAVAVLAVLAAVTLTNAKGAAPARQAAVPPVVPPGAPAERLAAEPVPSGITLTGPTVEAPDAEAAEVRKKLEKRISDFDFSNEPIGATVDFLHTNGNVNIVLDRKAVAEDSTITLKVSDATIASILDLICTQVQTNWTVVKNYVYISDEPGIERLLSRGPEGAKGAAPGRAPMVMQLGQPGSVLVGQPVAGPSGFFEPQVEAPDPEAAEVRKKLEKRFPNFDFSNEPIEAMVEFLRTNGNVNIVLDRKAVAEDSTITLKVSDATIASILDLICTQVPANWTVVKNYVYISDEPGIERLLTRGPEGAKGAVSREARQGAVGGYRGGGEKLEPLFNGMTNADVDAAKAALKDANIEYKIQNATLMAKLSDLDRVLEILIEKDALPKAISKQMQIAKKSNEALPSLGSEGVVVPGELWLTPDDIRLEDGPYCRFLAATIHSKRMTSLDVQLAAAELELQRTKVMAEKGAASMPDFEKARFHYEELKAKIAEQSAERQVRDVQVTFYLGDPEKGGKEIGTGGLDVDLGKEATKAIPWDAAPGSYEVFVTIGPGSGGPGSGDYRGLSWLGTKASTTVKIEAPFKLKEATEAK